MVDFWTSLTTGGKFGLLFGIVVGLLAIMGVFKYFRNRRMMESVREMQLERGRMSMYVEMNQRRNYARSAFTRDSRSFVPSPAVTRPGSYISTRSRVSYYMQPQLQRPEASYLLPTNVSTESLVVPGHHRPYPSAGGTTLQGSQGSAQLLTTQVSDPKRISSATIWPSAPESRADQHHKATDSAQSRKSYRLTLMPSEAELSGRIRHSNIIEPNRKSISPPPPPPKSPARSLRSARSTSPPEEDQIPLRLGEKENMDGPTQQKPRKVSPSELGRPLYSKNSKAKRSKSRKGEKELPRLEMPDSGRPFTVSVITNPESKTRSMVASLYSTTSSNPWSSRAPSPEPAVPEIPNLGFLPEIPNLPDLNDPVFEKDKKSGLRSSIHNAQHSISHLATFTFPEQAPIEKPLPALTVNPRHSVHSKGSGHRYSTSSGVLSEEQPPAVPPLPDHLRPQSSSRPSTAAMDELNYYFADPDDHPAPTSRFSHFSNHSRRSVASVGGVSKRDMAKFEQHEYGMAI